MMHAANCDSGSHQNENQQDAFSRAKSAWTNGHRSKSPNNSDAIPTSTSPDHQPGAASNSFFDEMLQPHHSTWFGREWSSGPYDREGSTEAQSTERSDVITHEVHRKLQEQLALKQQEVQEIQQKIVKNKKWDSRRGMQEKFKGSSLKHTVVRPFPETLNPEQKKRKTEGIPESNLDPNSPCFFPSQSVSSNQKHSQNESNQSQGPEFKLNETSWRPTAAHPQPINPFYSHDTTWRPRNPSIVSGMTKPAFNPRSNRAGFHQTFGRNYAKATPRHVWPTGDRANPSQNENIGDVKSTREIPQIREGGRLVWHPPTNPSRARVIRKATGRGAEWRSTNTQTHPPCVKCSSCKQNLVWPHVIECFHSLCFPCLVKNFNKPENKIQCPSCSTVTEVKGESLTSLDLDTIECKSLRAQSMNPFSCMTCLTEKQATFYCEDCTKFICQDCKIQHQSVTETSSHTLKDVSKCTDLNGVYLEKCTSHPDKPLELYCEDCNVLACCVCVTFDQDHHTHRIGDKDKLYPNAVSKVGSMTSHLDQMKNEMQRRIQPLSLLKQDIESSIRQCKQDIHKYSNHLLTETETCKTKARLLIDKMYDDMAKEVIVSQDLTNQYGKEYEPLVEFFRRYFLHSNASEFVTVASLLRKKLQNMDTKHNELQRHKDIFSASVQFEGDYSVLHDYIQNQYSRIAIRENLSEALPFGMLEMGQGAEDQEKQKPNQTIAEIIATSTGDVFDKRSSAPEAQSQNSDPQDEMFNYNRTAIGFVHQFGRYGRGDYEFVEPSGVLYLLDGSLSVCDTANHRILVYNNEFIHVRTIGQPPNLPPLRDPKDSDPWKDRHVTRTARCLYFPYRIAQCPQTENIVVIERPPSRDIQIFSVFGDFITCFGSDILQHPRGVAVDERGIIVTVEGRTMKLMLFSQEGRLLHRFYLSVHLEFPNDVAVRNGLIYISDNRGHCVHVFDYNAEHKRTIGNESVTYYPIGVSLTHLDQVVVTDNHNTFNISIFDTVDGRYVSGFKSKVRHANCYNVAVHPSRLELAVTSRENQVVVFNFDPCSGKEELEIKTSVAYFKN